MSSKPPISSLVFFACLAATTSAVAQIYTPPPTPGSGGTSGGTYSLTFAWDPSPGPDLSGNKMYFGNASGVYTNSVDVGNVVTAAIPGLTPDAVYYFVVVAYNSQGYESDPSNEVVYIRPSQPAQSASIGGGGLVSVFRWPGLTTAHPTGSSPIDSQPIDLGNPSLKAYPVHFHVPSPGKYVIEACEDLENMKWQTVSVPFSSIAEDGKNVVNAVVVFSADLEVILFRARSQ